MSDREHLSDIETRQRAQRTRERWADIKARSKAGGVCCGSCYFGFFYGLQHPDGGGYPCPKHATDEERREVDQKLSEALRGLDRHPLMQLVRRGRR